MGFPIFSSIVLFTLLLGPYFVINSYTSLNDAVGTSPLLVASILHCVAYNFTRALVLASIPVLKPQIVHYFNIVTRSISLIFIWNLITGKVAKQYEVDTRLKFSALVWSATSACLSYFIPLAFDKSLLAEFSMKYIYKILLSYGASFSVLSSIYGTYMFTKTNYFKRKKAICLSLLSSCGIQLISNVIMDLIGPYYISVLLNLLLQIILARIILHKVNSNKVQQNNEKEKLKKKK
ncbi:uncharacterized protein CMU_041930 [Cryptosporidium muris RN66]|uniref:Uncharacterized protein n=1 Tax=Cryptosporidium muris (strain RN66) TaxID=441375 RepID=B6AA79_CRYMR|nr:uncharacterized protein CMU_041930 [Cryptosporidium muris RN66]EEA05120.1 hypothetical protein CMU_041930 [Cryptosporidium muris RN66]|eukprot:XP_002139469.1 hypothetical protein [Cryptosporidium muris RN66]